MSERQQEWEFNSPTTNFLVVVVTIIGSFFVGFVAAAYSADDLRILLTCIEIGLGLAAVYLLFDLANSVKEVAYRS